MEIRHLKHFLAIVKSGSFTQGARDAHVSQPAISASIAKLEEELNTKLLNRNKKSVTLTPEGEKLKKSAELVVNELNAIRTRFSDESSPIVLRIWVAPTFTSDVFTPLLTELSRNISNLSLKIIEASPDQIIDALRNGKCDLGFTVEYDGGHQIAGIKVNVISEEAYGVAAPDGHPFTKQNSIELKDITDAPFIARTHCEYRNAVLMRLKNANLNLNIKHRTDQDIRALALVKAGLGVTIVPESLTIDGVGYTPFKQSDMKRRQSIFITPYAESCLGENMCLLDALRMV